MHALVRLAREAVERYIRHGTIMGAPAEPDIELAGRAGVFVCLKKHGELRGCIGTFQPQEPNIAEETIRNAISAATTDPRFPRVWADELDSLEYTVDVLTAPEPVAGIADLDPKRYGVIVRSGPRRGLLLPDLEGVDTAAFQVSIAMQKAGIPPDAPVELSRFEVKRYH